ncbi:hypothetical protein [Pseudomonas protegens]|uniref:hypothetical protein n=1 Tax=Pseudomonas protegens TaxID=380021 RepID=UPI00383ACB81
MRVKPLFLATVACCNLQAAAAAETQANVTHKAIPPLGNAHSLLNAIQAKGWPCTVVIADDGASLVAGIELAEGAIVNRRTAP